MFRAASEGTRKVITANRLADGLVVFLDAKGGWPLDLGQARILADDEELAGAEAYAKRQHDERIVVEPYAIDVELVDGRPVPTRLRERIRALGPTVAYGAAELAQRAAAE